MDSRIVPLDLRHTSERFLPNACTPGAMDLAMYYLHRGRPAGARQSGLAVPLCKPFPAQGSPWCGQRGLVDPSPAVGDAAGVVLRQGALPQPAPVSAAFDGATNLLARWKTEEVVLPAGWGFMTAAALSSCTLPSCAQAELVKPRAPTARPCMDEFTH